MFFAFGIILIGYWLGWDGYATLQQPTGPNPSGVGIMDLLLPSRISKVDQAIQANWNKGVNNTASDPLGSSGNSNSTNGTSSGSGVAGTSGGATNSPSSTRTPVASGTNNFGGFDPASAGGVNNLPSTFPGNNPNAGIFPIIPQIPGTELI